MSVQKWRREGEDRDAERVREIEREKKEGERVREIEREKKRERERKIIMRRITYGDINFRERRQMQSEGKKKQI